MQWDCKLGPGSGTEELQISGVSGDLRQQRLQLRRPGGDWGSSQSRDVNRALGRLQGQRIGRKAFAYNLEDQRCLRRWALQDPIVHKLPMTKVWPQMLQAWVSEDFITYLCCEQSEERRPFQITLHERAVNVEMPP